MDKITHIIILRDTNRELAIQHHPYLAVEQREWLTLHELDGSPTSRLRKAAIPSLEKPLVSLSFTSDGPLFFAECYVREGDENVAKDILIQQMERLVAKKEQLVERAKGMLEELREKKTAPGMASF